MNPATTLETDNVATTSKDKPKSTPAVGSATTEVAATKDEPKVEARPVMQPRITEFRGVYKTRVPRFVTITDLKTGKADTQRDPLEGPQYGVLQAIIGKGRFATTNEPFITCLVQYNMGETCRVTFSSQNLKPALAMMHKNVDDSSGEVGGNPSAGIPGRIHWPLYKELVITAYGKPMSSRRYVPQDGQDQGSFNRNFNQNNRPQSGGHSIIAHELYLHTDPANLTESKVIIGGSSEGAAQRDGEIFSGGITDLEKAAL